MKKSEKHPFKGKNEDLIPKHQVVGQLLGDRFLTCPNCGGHGVIILKEEHNTLGYDEHQIGCPVCGGGGLVRNNKR